MNREDIIRMYAKANGWSPAAFTDTLEELERFAALVASAEREACAKVCEDHSTWTGRMCAETIKARGQKPVAYESSIGYMFGDKR